MSDDESITNGHSHGMTGDFLDLRKSHSPGANGDQQLSEDDADLFGDGSDAPEPESNGLDRQLDDSELDSADDEGRKDRIAQTVEDDEQDEEEDRKEVRLMPAEIARISPPEAEELYLLNMPSFLGLSQKKFDPITYEPPTKGHGSEAPDANFSPFATASTSLHWRRDPKDNSKLQSNSRIIRWSDGSLTLQIASSPQDQYRISTQALRQSFGKKNQKAGPQTDYDPSKDAQFYLAAEHAQVPSVHQIVAPLDAALKILPTGDQADESVLKLQQSLAAATNVHDPLTALKQVKEDPELAKKAAEMFEKDRLRSTRRRERAEENLLTRKDRVLGRSGLGGSGRGGLSVAGLEDEDGMPVARGSKNKGLKDRRRRVNRHGEIYSDDEDEDLPRGRTREDEYDLEDDFMAASDEEPEIYDESDKEVEEEEEDDDDDPDVDDLEIEGHETVVQGKTRGGERDRNQDRRRERKREKTISRSRAVTPKRALDEEEGDAEAERAGAGSPQARKKRRVIDDDDEEDE